MKILFATLSLIAASSLVQCERDSGQRIPVGVYEEPSGQERIAARDKALEFQVRLLGGRHEGEIVRIEYPYEVLTTGEIHMSGVSSDSAFIEGILKYRWSWDGTRIIRHRVESTRDENGNLATKLGARVIFEPKAASH